MTSSKSDRKGGGAERADVLKITAVILCALAIGGTAGLGQNKAAEELKYAIILSRHGVRSPTWTAARLNQYSASPWPSWDVPPGNLTPHGRALMKIMGGFYREYFQAQGLSEAFDCKNAGGVYFRADTAQRTMESARALEEGMLPGCSSEIHSLGDEQRDALFEGNDGATADGAIGLAAVRGRIGAKLQAAIDARRAAFEVLSSILMNGKASRSLFEEPISLEAGSSGVSMKGPLSLSSTLSEDLLLEYVEGMSGEKLGWGRLTRANLQEVMALHTAYAELMRRTPALARVRGANLMACVRHSLEQAMTGKAVDGAIGLPSTRVLVLIGHDTNLSNLSGMLGLSWVLPSYQPDDAPPGSGLLFTLWRSSTSGSYSVRVQFMAQTLDQMQGSVALTLAEGPATAGLFVPSCSVAADGYACGWESFVAAAGDAVTGKANRGSGHSSPASLRGGRGGGERK